MEIVEMKIGFYPSVNFGAKTLTPEELTKFLKNRNNFKSSEIEDDVFAAGRDYLRQNPTAIKAAENALAQGRSWDDIFWDLGLNDQTILSVLKTRYINRGKTK